MKINWQELLITGSIVVVTAAATGFSTWWGMEKISQDQQEEIKLLENQTSTLTQEYEQLVAKKAEEEQNKIKTTTITPVNQPDTQSTPSSSEPITEDSSSSAEVPQTQSQSQILYFYSPTCGVCIAEEPIVAQAQSEGVSIAHMNIVENPAYLPQYGITGTPTFILNNQRRAGYMTKAQLLNFWNTYK